MTSSRSAAPSNPAGSFSEVIELTRFTDDARRLEAIMGEDGIGSSLPAAATDASRQTARKRLLASAVRVDVRYLPELAAAFDRLERNARLGLPIEAYVYADAAIQAAVMAGRSHHFVVLSSGAVNDLEPAELDFVIGHELGHASFGHLDIAVGHLIHTGDVTAGQVTELLAWQRAAEISADRAGLVCCGSVDVAANALFKMLSGLGRIEIHVRPDDFAEQWDHLANEVLEHGEADAGHFTHPFPPLRMRAMMTFWDQWGRCRDLTSAEIREALAPVDDEIGRLLALMDPRAREGGGQDALLERFVLWGGLHVAAANGRVDDEELVKMETLVGANELRAALAEGPFDGDACLERFAEVFERRAKKLSALEVHRILEACVGVALSDGDIDSDETGALEQIGSVLGVPKDAVRLVVQNAVPGDEP